MRTHSSVEDQGNDLSRQADANCNVRHVYGNFNRLTRAVQRHAINLWMRCTPNKTTTGNSCGDAEVGIVSS